MKHLLFISLLMTVNQLYAQDLIRLSPYGKENCYEFMTQGYRGNVVSVIAEDGTHYKIKMNKLEQIEWVVDDPSEALYSMLDSGLLIGAYSKENKIYINCREKNGDLRWVKSEDGGAYSFDIIEMNDQQFVLAAGDFYKTSLLCMDLVGNVIWKTSFRTSMHLANSGDVIFTNGQGILVLGEKLEARDSLYFTQLDNNGQVLWQKRKYFITQEGGIVIYQDDDGGFIIYDPDTYSEVNDYSSTLRIVKLDKDLQEVDRKEYPVDYPCGLIPFTAFPYVDQILPYYDSLIYSVGSYSDEEDELLIYCPGIENCYNRPVRFELLNSFECRPSTFVGNYLMKQRGTNDFIVAFARQDEDGLYSRFCNFDLDFINYMGHQYKINVFSSDNNCNAISRKEMFKNWIFYHKFGSASVLEWDKTRDFIVVPEIQDPKINSAIYGYDFCLDDRTDYIGGEIDYLIKPVEGLGVAINLSASADGLERTGKLYLKYWRYGAEWIDGSAISIITFPGVKLNHPGIEQINDTTWQLKLDEIDLFTNYQEELTMDYSAVAGDSLFFQAIITPEMAAPVGMLRSRVYQMPEVREESINVSVQNTSRMDDFIHQGDRILYTLSYTNNSPDTVRDLRFYNALSGTSYESFAPEISSLPIDTRSIGEGLGNSIDISVPNIDLIPGQSFFATFSINPSNVNCGREIKNSITTVVNYQHLDTTLIQIKYRGVGREETLDTFLSIGAEFNGMKISGDTMLTKIISNENGCDTILHYNIHTSTVATEESSFDGTRIYPNPFQHAFTIDEVEGRIKSIKIYDVHGKEIPFQKFDNNRISIDGHSQGILLVRIIRADGTMYWSRMLKL